MTIVDNMNAEAEEQEELLRQRLQITTGLQEGVVEVNFLKRDGTARTMRCTLNDKYLPPQKEVTEGTADKSNDYIAVWDLEKEGWRSFRFDSVTGYTIGVNHE